ncbi:MAG: hypothetical protein QXD43_05900 [Candidatus Aenigmatarchaeota archaeon]
MGFTDIFIEPTPIKITEVTSHFHLLITGNKINRLLRKVITTHELAGEGTTIFRELPAWRKVVFKSLKGLKSLIFFIPALVVKYNIEGMHLYFQCKL